MADALSIGLGHRKVVVVVALLLLLLILLIFVLLLLIPLPLLFLPSHPIKCHSILSPVFDRYIH